MQAVEQNRCRQNLKRCIYHLLGCKCWKGACPEPVRVTPTRLTRLCGMKTAASVGRHGCDRWQTQSNIPNLNIPRRITTGDRATPPVPPLLRGTWHPRTTYYNGEGADPDSVYQKAVQEKRGSLIIALLWQSSSWRSTSSPGDGVVFL